LRSPEFKKSLVYNNGTGVGPEIMNELEIRYNREIFRKLEVMKNTKQTDNRGNMEANKRASAL
jgi:hypothetical protein